MCLEEILLTTIEDTNRVNLAVGVA
jgi:small conductance mechanosensitive channel